MDDLIAQVEGILGFEQQSNARTKSSTATMRPTIRIKCLKCQSHGHEEHQCPDEEYVSKKEHAVSV